MLDEYPELALSVSKLTTEINRKPLPEIRIWNEKWGTVGITMDANNFEMLPKDILKYAPYSYNPRKRIGKKRSKNGKLPPCGDPLEW